MKLTCKLLGHASGPYRSRCSLLGQASGPGRSRCSLLGLASWIGGARRGRREAAGTAKAPQSPTRGAERPAGDALKKEELHNRSVRLF